MHVVSPGRGAEQALPRVRARLLGPLEVEVDGVPVHAGPPKQQALLALLLIHRGEAVATDRLVDVLWGERPPRTAAHSVQIYVSDLRRTFVGAGAGPTIVTRRPGYVIEREAVDVDVDQFHDRAAAGREALLTDSSAAVELLNEALGLWRGDPLPEVAAELLVAPETQGWQERRLDVLEDLAQALLDDGDLMRALSTATSVSRLDPLREHSRGLMMRALYRAGRASEALHAFTAYRTMLSNELGLDPSPGLARLQEQILLHDPDLLPAMSPPVSISVPARNPFKGLRPFTEEDADDFFGRDRLVQEVLTCLADHQRLVAVVGPSGSGKSSLVAAGVLPLLRAAQGDGTEPWVIVVHPPGARSLSQLEASLSRCLVGAAPGLAPVPGTGRALLVMDQFESLLVPSADEERGAFLDRLCQAITDPDLQLTVVLTLRADLYDRPLRHRNFGEIFARSVLNVLPMTAQELEAAVVGPATGVGAHVEPALLAVLMMDGSVRPGVLPLLQYALTEVFERALGGPLRLADYRAIGGLQGALSRRAEQVRQGWDEAREAVAVQLLLRLTHPADQDRVGRHRLPVGDLVALEGADPVAASAVLEDLARHRLISFDRDAEGRATVEVAHESIFEEWRWLRELVARHRLALRRLASLRLAVEEWEGADRNPAYLLGAGRLEEIHAWRQDGVIQLTGREAAFVEACVAKADHEAVMRTRRDEDEARLRHVARRRAWFAGGSAAALLAVVASLLLVDGDAPVPRVAYVLNVSSQIEVLAESGIDRAAAETPITVARVETDRPEAEIDRLADAGQDLVVVISNDTDLAPVARRHPDTAFVLVQDHVDGDNVTNLEFADQEAAFLAGAAAALTSRSGGIGFVGGADTATLLRFQAGYVAGARSVDPSVRVRVAYASRLPDYSGFLEPALTARAARPLLAAGVDVVFAPAGTAQFGAIQAVIDASEEQHRRLWAIGADEDVYSQDGWQRTASSRRHILTSTLKRFDVAVHDAVRDYADGRLRSGSRVYDLSNAGVGLATSGGFLERHADRLAALRQQIVAGTLVVPCVPDGFVGARARAAASGAGCP